MIILCEQSAFLDLLDSPQEKIVSENSPKAYGSHFNI